MLVHSCGYYQEKQRSHRIDFRKGARWDQDFAVMMCFEETSQQIFNNFVYVNDIWMTYLDQGQKLSSVRIFHKISDI